MLVFEFQRRDGVEGDADLRAIAVMPTLTGTVRLI